MEKGIRTGPAKGRSGAVIVLTERRAIKVGARLHQQYSYLSALYPLTPRTYGYMVIDESREEDMYIMERLEEPDFNQPDWSVNTLKAMRKSLEVVWARSSPSRDYGTYRDWQRELTEFCGKKGFDIKPIVDELAMECVLAGAPYVIHGDPTLANVMFRKNPLTPLVICDPIVPQGKIPSHYTVDIGKMLQSAIGWENLLFGLEQDNTACVAAVFGKDPSGLEVRRGWFWCMVHLLRILPYVSVFGDEYLWAHANARAIYKDLISQKVDGVCYMPSI